MEYSKCDTMDFFSTSESEMPPIKENMSQNEALDYIVLVMTRLFSGDVAFKGGYMLNQLLHNSRRTQDVDLSIMEKGDYETVKKILKDIAEVFVANKYITTYRIKDDITSTSSGGIDMYGADGRKFLGVDVGLHDISYGVKHYQLSFVGVEAFEVERMMSDKIVAILSKRRFRRTKDLYDVYALVNVFDLDFQKLLKCIDMHDVVEWDNIPFSEDILITYRKAWEKLIIRSVSDNSILDKPNFEEVLDLFMRITCPLKLRKRGIIKWDCQRRGWIYE